MFFEPKTPCYSVTSVVSILLGQPLSIKLTAHAVENRVIKTNTAYAGSEKTDKKAGWKRRFWQTA